LPQFDAGSVVEGLECTLQPYSDFTGTIKEPNDQQVASFFKGLRDVAKEVRGQIPDDLDQDDANSVLDALNSMDIDVTVRFADEVAVIYSALCSGHPTKRQILAVPPRRRQAFYNWLQSEVMNPEAGGGAGSPAPATPQPSLAG
jgi:hypothetical protein